jgi:hypothetical protein
LEYLEDKLREYRFLEPAELENKVCVASQTSGLEFPALAAPCSHGCRRLSAAALHPALRRAPQPPMLRYKWCAKAPRYNVCVQAVLLGQLDAVRRELVEVVDRFLPHVVFGKDAVRAVLAFAQVGAMHAAMLLPWGTSQDEAAPSSAVCAALLAVCPLWFCVCISCSRPCLHALYRAAVALLIGPSTL